MKEGKIIYIDKENFNEKDLEEICKKLKNDKILVEFASEKKNGFYTLQEALLNLVKRGAKRVTAISLSLPQVEVPIYWGTF